MLKRIVFSALILWALVDAALAWRNMPTVGLKLYGAFLSFGDSMLFVGAVYWAWGWISRRRNPIVTKKPWAPSPTESRTCATLNSQVGERCPCGVCAND